MTLPLILRPLQIRLKVGVIVDSAFGPFEYVKPGSAILRTYNDKHPYSIMWSAINDTFFANHWEAMSNDNLSRHLDNMLREPRSIIKSQPWSFDYSPQDAEKGIRVITRNEGGHVITLGYTGEVSKEKVAAAATRWLEYGWINYEERKGDKIKATTSAARIAAIFGGALSGFNLLTEQ